MVGITLIISISLIIFISPLVSKVLNLPTITIEIMLGSIAAYASFLDANNEIFELISEVGFLYLMFLAGLEVDFRELIKIPKKILKKALLYNFILLSLSVAITFYLNLSRIFIVILPLISIGLLAALKKEYGDSEWIKLSIVVGLIGEIVSIFALTTVSVALEVGINFHFYKTMFLFIVFLFVLIFVFKIFHNIIWWFPEIKHYLMPREDHQEQDIRISMAFFFLMIAVMLLLHLEVAFGAFIAGTFLATFFEEHNKKLSHKLEHFGFGWLIPIFFIWVGASFDLRELMHFGLILKSIEIVFIMLFIRLVASLLFVKTLGWCKFYLLGLSHSMPLTLLIAVSTIAYNNNSITQEYFYAFILAAILEVLIVMTLIKIINTFLKLEKNK